jgi:hypothetical protein
MTTFWASDGDVSMPVPPEHPVVLDYDGFGLTEHGLVHNVTADDVEEMRFPTFAPSDYVPGTAIGETA